jgi:hypothetical protein
MNLPSSIKLSQTLRRQMGDFNYVRYCRNLGVDFETVYTLMFGRIPRI